MSFTLHRTILDQDNKVVSGVKVCLDGTSHCATSDDKGIVDLALPADTDVRISYEKEGHVPKLHQDRTGAPGETTPGLAIWILQTRQWYDDAAVKFGGAFDLEHKGIIGLQTALGTDVDFDYAPEAPGVIGPFWFKLVGGSLDSCVVKAECDSSTWAFADMPPGCLQGLGEVSGKPCTPRAFPCVDGKTGCTDMDVRAGWVTHSGWLCD